MMMKRLRRNNGFLRSILNEANQNRREVMLHHANRDQINSISEMVLNLLRNKIPTNQGTVNKLKKYKTILREIGRRKNSVKRRREHLIQQKGAGFWKGLKQCHQSCQRCLKK
jgi:hypothetical protein